MKFIEVTNGPRNWGKFAIGTFDYDDWQTKSAVATVGNRSHLSDRGWTREHKLVLDLQTGEGAIFKIGGLPQADLEKHRIWVCPMFLPFLEWLYKQDVRDLTTLPDHVDLPDAPFSMTGYRRKGPNQADVMDMARLCGLPIGDDVGQYYWRRDLHALVRRNANGTDTLWEPTREVTRPRPDEI